VHHEDRHGDLLQVFGEVGARFGRSAPSLFFFADSFEPPTARCPPETSGGFKRRSAMRAEAKRAENSQLLELLETVALLTGFDNPVGDVDRLDWLVD